MVVSVPDCGASVNSGCTLPTCAMSNVNARRSAITFVSVPLAEPRNGSSILSPILVQRQSNSKIPVFAIEESFQIR